MTDSHHLYFRFVGLFALPVVLLVGWGSGLWYQHQLDLLTKQLVASELTQLREEYDQTLLALQAKTQTYARSQPGGVAAPDLPKTADAHKTNALKNDVLKNDTQQGMAPKDSPIESDARATSNAALLAIPGLQLYSVTDGELTQLWPAAPLPQVPDLPSAVLQRPEQQAGILFLKDKPYLLARVATEDAWLLALRPFVASELQLPGSTFRIELNRAASKQEMPTVAHAKAYLLPLLSLDGSSLALAVIPTAAAMSAAALGLSIPTLALMLLGLGLLSWGFVWLRKRQLAPQRRLAQEFARHEPADGPLTLHGAAHGELQLLLDSANRWLELVADTRAESMAMLEALKDGVIVTDTAGKVSYANRAARQLVSADERALTGEQLEVLIGLEPQDIADFAMTGQQLRRQQQLRLAGSLLRCHLSRIQSSAGVSQGVIVALTDMTVQAQNEAELQRLTARAKAHADPVTGLLNRAGFAALLAQGMVDGFCVTLCSLNLEQFKLINENCGHSEGDRMLELVARTLRSSLGPRDVVARLDGDEFALLIPERSAHEVAMVLKELQRQVSMLALDSNGHSYRVGASIGVAFVGAPAAQLGEHLKDAQIACQAAKRKGSNQIHVFDANDTELNHERNAPEWAMRMANAIYSDELELFFQPIQALCSTNPRQRMEVLLRIREPDGKLLSPAQFIASAERFKLMPQVDKAVIALTMAYLAARPGLWQDHCLSINLSGNSLGAEGMEAFIMAELNRHGIPAHCLCFEITETTALQNRQRTLAMLRRLRKQGFAFAIDDFGSGFASYGYLRELPVDYVKIDGCFVRQLADNVKDYAIVKSIHDVCTVMGIETVAEFVESSQTISKLEEIGVNYIQGYAVGRPKALRDYAIALPMGRRA